MFDFFTPANWFWVFLAILICCYVKIQSHMHTPTPAFAPASIATFFRGV